jgi:hypothetical protein
MIPFDQGVFDNGITGSPVDESRSPAIQAVAHLATSLESGNSPEKNGAGVN